MVNNAKSLGGALSNGRFRNAAVLSKRLARFQVRKTQFQKLRRAVGIRRQHAVLRSGGTAALVYGLGNSGVSDSMLHAQRSAVSAASVLRGHGDMDFNLLIADGSKHGKADPAFAAHEIPITRWAEAVWESWLPRAALALLLKLANRALQSRSSPWQMARGPACAFVATVRRLGWTVENYFTLVTDEGYLLDLTRDSPAMVQRITNRAVWRWRWRKIERKHPILVQGGWGVRSIHVPAIQAAQRKRHWRMGPSR